MSKGIAIRTILLLVVGILVVGILVYLVYSYTSSGQLSVYECRVRLTELCTQCSNMDFKGFALDIRLTNECSKYGEFSGWSGISNCAPGGDPTGVKNLCKGLGVT